MSMRDKSDQLNCSCFALLDPAFRYQLYEMMYYYRDYQGIYTPDFLRYLSEAFRNVIKKSFTKMVMSFWKWETLWGKFSTNYDPVLRNNIMVSSFLLQGMMLYIANTSNSRYVKYYSIEFVVTDDNAYKHSIHTMDKAMGF